MKEPRKFEQEMSNAASWCYINLFRGARPLKMPESLLVSAIVNMTARPTKDSSYIYAARNAAIIVLRLEAAGDL